MEENLTMPVTQDGGEVAAGIAPQTGATTLSISFAARIRMGYLVSSVSQKRPKTLAPRSTVRSTSTTAQSMLKQIRNVSEHVGKTHSGQAELRAAAGV